MQSRDWQAFNDEEEVDIYKNIYNHFRALNAVLFGDEIINIFFLFLTKNVLWYLIKTMSVRLFNEISEMFYFLE